jgi:hypothetical protein
VTDLPQWAFEIMKMKIALVVISIVLAFGAGLGVVHAAVSFGTGVYVNLCGSGTVATSYTCDPGCNPNTGVCSGSNNGVVRWVCSGKWNQCLESESDWMNREELGNPGCNKTVQVSLFDKKCRREDGAWDQTCNLLGYMVWFSGECGGGVSPGPTSGVTVISSPKVTARPTARPTVTVRPTETIVPTPTLVSKFSMTPTPGVAVRVCGKRCGADVECGAGFACVGNLCRNPACPSDVGCFCGGVGGVATSSGLNQSPETGAEVWLILVGLVGVGIVGLKMREMAKRLW